MTAANTIVHQDHVDILSDGAIYDYDGALTATVSKVWALPPLPAALTARGPAFLLPFLAVRVSDAAGSFDDLLPIIVEQARKSAELDASLFEHHPAGQSFELFVAGWSAQHRRAMAFTLASFETCGRESWTLHDIGPGIVSPADEALGERIGDLEINLLSADCVPEIDGLILLEEQRARSWPITGTDRVEHIVGGHAQLTTVNEQGVTSRILRRWPDRIGQRIAPQAARIAA